MQEVKYDADVLKAYAKVLYDQADSIVFWTAVRWAAIGMFMSMAAISASAQGRPELNLVTFMVVLVVAVFAGSLGKQSGDSKAWMIRLDAQRALCQLQVEVNTRK
jgi:hypothetical protein